MSFDRSLRQAQTAVQRLPLIFGIEIRGFVRGRDRTQQSLAL
jgi:hypothetical protein